MNETKQEWVLIIGAGLFVILLMIGMVIQIGITASNVSFCTNNSPEWSTVSDSDYDGYENGKEVLTCIYNNNYPNDHPEYKKLSEKYIKENEKWIKYKSWSE